MQALYEKELFIYDKIPVQVYNHIHDGEDIFTLLHWHKNVEFHIAISGRISWTVDGISKNLYPGDLLIVNSKEPHSNKWININDHYEGITVKISQSFLEYWIGENIYYTLPEDSNVLKEISNTLRTFGEFAVNSGKGDIEKMELTFHFLNLLKRHCANKKSILSDKKEKELDDFRNIIVYIEKNYTRPITLTLLAEEFHYSSGYLSRIFKKHVGDNFHRYLQNVRIIHCVDDMRKNKNISLLDCAVDNGFSSVKTFYRAFQQLFNSTPSEWMKKQ